MMYVDELLDGQQILGGEQLAEVRTSLTDATREIRRKPSAVSAVRREGVCVENSTPVILVANPGELIGERTTSVSKKGQSVLVGVFRNAQKLRGAAAVVSPRCASGRQHITGMQREHIHEGGTSVTSGPGQALQSFVASAIELLRQASVEVEKNLLSLSDRKCLEMRRFEDAVLSSSELNCLKTRLLEGAGARRKVQLLVQYLSMAASALSWCQVFKGQNKPAREVADRW
jgi:hypothetical protein